MLRLPTRTKALRNGVGIKKDGKVYFACMEASMREFAEHFLKQGCQNALYLDSDHPDVWHKGNSKKKFKPIWPDDCCRKIKGGIALKHHSPG